MCTLCFFIYNYIYSYKRGTWAVWRRTAKGAKRLPANPLQQRMGCIRYMISGQGPPSLGVCLRSRIGVLATC